MPLLAIRKPSWEERAARAEELARSYPFAEEILSFYGELIGFQKSLHAHFASGKSSGPKQNGPLPDTLDFSILRPWFQIFLRLVERVGPGKMGEMARELEQQGPAEWEAALQSFWGTKAVEETEPLPQRVFAKMFLQPLAEYLAEHAEFPRENYSQPVCPFCGSKPALGTLRPEGDGAKRSLVCSLCATEWLYRRLVCPACGEEDVHKLPIYTADTFQYVRVEACDTCKSYIKTVDLSKNGLAIPVVDELAAVPLTLWAEKTGYHKLQLNLLGM